MLVHELLDVYFALWVHDVLLDGEGVMDWEMGLRSTSTSMTRCPNTLNSHLHPPVGCSVMTDEIVIIPEWHERGMAEVRRRYSYSNSEFERFRCGCVGGSVQNNGHVPVLAMDWEDGEKL